MAAALHDIAMLPEPVGEIISSSIRPNGLEVQKVRVPLGVVALVLGAAAFHASTGHVGILDRAFGAPPAQPSAPKYTIPPELDADVKTMLDASKASERRKAAQNVLAFREPKQLEPYLLAVAHLESSRGCKDRKDAIREITEIADARALDALRRLASASKTGCGFLDLEDCYSCVRADLRRAIDTMDAKTSPKPNAP